MSNTKSYEGDVKDLPHCSTCIDENGERKTYAEDAKHDFLTQEHPYEMLEEAKSEDENTEGGSL